MYVLRQIGSRDGMVDRSSSLPSRSGLRGTVGRNRVLSFGKRGWRMDSYHYLNFQSKHNLTYNLHQPLSDLFHYGIQNLNEALEKRKWSK